MTQTSAHRAGLRARIVLALILVAGLALRARGIGFGLPALYDPDEPIFVLTALKLLREQTLNPAWFGHPGTTTIYALALIDLLVLGAGLVTGRFADTAAFARAIYADPGVVVLPGRWFILACGLATIALTYLLGRRLFGERTGLIAAGFLAIDPLHITYSQIIRTDMQETVFLLLCVLACVGIARRGARRDYLWAAVWLGLAVATKWPAITVAAAIAGAAVHRMRQAPEVARTHLARLVMVGPVALATLIAASPFLILDFPIALANVTAETRNHHPGATGHGFLGNMAFYLGGPLHTAFGTLGLLLAAAGFVAGSRRSGAFAATVVPVALVSFVAIAAQALVWERWMVPLLPFVTIALAALIDLAVRRLAAWRRGAGPALGVALVGSLAVPLLMAGEAAARERVNDTRALASAFARAHIAPGDRVIVEQLSFDLVGAGWRFLFPVGDAGCVDVAAALKARIPYTTVERWRNGRSVIDLGSIDPATFATCRADWAIVAGYDRYRAEPDAYPGELAIYRALIARGRVVATFSPVPGEIGGRTIRVIRLNPADRGWATVPKP